MTKKLVTEWNLEKLFKSIDDPAIDEDVERAKTQTISFITKWKDRMDYLLEPKVMKEALDEFEELWNTTGIEGNAGYYLWLKLELDKGNPGIKAKINKIENQAVKLANDLQFFSHRISKISDELQPKFLSYTDLSEYHHFLKKLFEEGKYLLSEDEEKILTLKAKTSGYNWVQMTSQLVSKEEAKVLTEEGTKEVKPLAEIVNLVNSKDKKVRDVAAKAFDGIMVKWVEVAEIEMNSILEDHRINDELRKVDRPDKMRHVEEDIDTEVVDALVSAVSDRNDLSKRFYTLKAKLLGLKKLDYHERNLEIGSVTKKYSYEESIELVSEVFKNLHPTFLRIFKEFSDDGRIDAFPKKGKDLGAFCASGLNFQPVYILLNHTNQLRDVLTLAHEVGHGIHFVLARKQNALNSGGTLSTAEVASTFMEDFVLQEVMKTVNEEDRLNLLVAKLNDDISTIHRQIACYRFEQELHATFREKGYLSKEEIGNMFHKHMGNYLGDAVKLSPGSENWWVYWSHIRRFFYVYSYANGLLISKSLQTSVKNDHNFVEKVIEFFESGTSDTTKNIFLKLGIDISKKEFWDKGLMEIEALLDETEALAVKLGKIN